MKKFFAEFKKFITRGNVMDMAVGVIVGGAFTAIVNGLSNFILKPLINFSLFKAFGADSLSDLYTFLNRVDKTQEILADDGTVIGTYPLSVDREVEIVTGENGEERNLLVIKDGKATVTAATCPDGICTSHKPISREGESIVCLPNRVEVRIVGSSDVDFVVR